MVAVIVAACGIILLVSSGTWAKSVELEEINEVLQGAKDIKAEDTNPIDDDSEAKRLIGIRDKEPVQLVVVPEDDDDDWEPECAGANEVWSKNIKCEVRCDFGGWEDYDHGYGGYGHNDGFRSSSQSGCHRTVSDAL